jgi:hypothetical protein
MVPPFHDFQIFPMFWAITADYLVGIPNHWRGHKPCTEFPHGRPHR